MEKIQKIKAPNKDLKTYYHTVKSTNVRRNVMPGNSASLWKAVKIAKDQNVSTMFNVIKENGIEIPREQLPDRFGTFFFNKVKNLTDTIHARDDVYNGKKKVESTNRMFMDLASVKECMLSLKIKLMTINN